ncbi:MAG: transposase family protein [Bryobacterales bacterium]|nr:transposase family protein [Bryobacterales bacterium]
MAHLYRLRQSRSYRQQRVRYQKTRPTAVAIGERRRPDPQGRPGFLRVDTVHQGDRDGEKGLYHINAVDEVTQWQIVGATAHISEAWLEPVLAALLEQFPFQRRSFHSGNGSEFINQTVARLLNKLLVEQTKSQPRHSNDNGLVEGKNGAVIRKHIGYGHIAAEHAEAFQAFYREHFNPYLNFHRPCGGRGIKAATAIRPPNLQLNPLEEEPGVSTLETAARSEREPLPEPAPVRTGEKGRPRPGTVQALTGPRP